MNASRVADRRAWVARRVRRRVSIATLGIVLGCQTTPSAPVDVSPGLADGVVRGTSASGPFDDVVVFIGAAGPDVSCYQPSLSIDGRTVQMAPLFAAGPGRLQSYCRLTLVADAGRGWPPLSAVRQALSGLYATAKVGPDPIGIVQTPTQFGPLVDRTWKEHFDRFRYRAGTFDVRALPQRATPRLAFIDSATTASTPGWTVGLPAEAYRDHGLALARIAEEMLCEDGAATKRCLAEIVSVRALHATQRGVQGTLGDLAVGIVQAVTEAPNPDALTINLSVGWVNPAMGGKHGDIFRDDREEPAAAAVHEAIQYARCRGAAIVAAAGNRSGAFDANEAELIYPSHWFRDHGARSIDCAAEFGVDRATANVPLVTAVGAIADGDQPLAVVRADSEPTLVANGMAAVGRTRGGAMTPTGLLSGTSVATAVVSAQIAALQHVFPDRSAQAIERALPSWARHLTRVSAAGPTDAYAVRLVDVLQAAGGPALDALGSAATGFELPAAAGRLLVDGRTTTACPSTVVAGRALSARECTWLTWESVDERPFTHPQPSPSGGGCPSCMLKLDRLLLLVDLPVESDFVPRFLEIIDDKGSVYFALPKDIPVGSLQEIELKNPPRALIAPVAARLVMVDDNDKAISAIELFVW